MRWLLFWCLIFSFKAWSQLEYSAKFSREVATKEASELKQILLFESALKGMDHFSKGMGFEYKTFREKLDQKFLSHFIQFKERKLLEKFGNGQEKLTSEEKERFFLELDQYKEQELIKFSRLTDAIQSSKIKKLIQEPGSPHLWKAEVDVVLDKIKLDKIVKRTLSDSTVSDRTLWLVPEFNLIGLTWKDFGYEKEASFVDPLTQSWQKWIVANLPAGIEDAEICSSDCLLFYKKWEQLDIDQLIRSAENDFSSGAWVKVSINIRRPKFNSFSLESQFEWDGKLVILDVNTKRVLGSFELSTEKKEWRGLDQKSLNSALASRVYRTPLVYFKEMNLVFSKPTLNRVSRLSIKGHKHAGDVLALIELLKKKGTSIGLELKLDKIKSNEAQIICFYQGEEKSFSDLLSQLKELKSSDSYRIVNEFSGVHHVLKLVNE